jgi:putative chitinase
MGIHRSYFFDNLKFYLFKSYTQDQVDGLNVFLDWYDSDANPPIPDRYHLGDRELAYILATTYHETAATMQPIAEYGKGKGMKYGTPDPATGQTYYGRGYVQLTWKENYARQDQKLDMKGRLVATADLALDPDVALQVIIGGMVDGDFTGKKLGQFFTDTVTDWYNARTIVNGHDRAQDIADYAEKFLNGIAHT